MTGNPNLTGVLKAAMNNRLAELNTSMPAKIVSYDFKTQKAQVQPTINRKYKDGRIERFPVINNVPVIFPRSGGASLTFPVKSGDGVLLVFANRSLDNWLFNGGQVNQDDNRMHDLNDAIAIPGLFPFSEKSKAKNNEDVLLTYSGAEIEIKSSGQVNVKSPLKLEITAPDTVIDSETVRITGDLITEGNISDLDEEYGTFNNIRVVYDIHTHPENNTGSTDAPNQKLGD